MKRATAKTLTTLTIMAFFGMNLGAEPLEVGAEAPAFTAVDETGGSVNLGEVYDRGLTLVYFYPKANTPGCTAQACSLRDSIADLREDGVTVLGVSHDSPKAQMKFKEAYDLPFTLIADADGKVIEAFGVPTMPTGASKRQSFLIKDGKVAWRSLKAETKGHADEVRKAVAEVSGSES
ncbi:MAG: peroxiredoxin [Chthoniobacterales bacterium]